MGEDLTSKGTLLNQKTQLSTNVFWSTAYSDLRTENVVTYEPNADVTPIVTFGDSLTTRTTVTSAARALESQGYRVVAGINGDFFNTSNGLPIGILVSEGEVLSSSGMAGIFKIVLIFASIFVGGVMAYADMGHWQGLTQSFAAYPWFSLFGRGVEDGLVSLGSMIVGVISTQTYVQALFSARDTKTAAVGCCAAALIVIPVGLPSVMIGMFMHLHHPEINSIDALPLYLVTYLPQCLGGIGLGAVLLSALGSIAGLALGVGTMISRDIVSKIWLKATAAGQLWASRLSVLAVSVTAMVFVFMHLDSSVLEWNYLSMALRGSGIFLPLTFCIFFPGRVRASMGVAAMGAGIFAALFWKHISPWEINSLLPALVYNLFFLLIGLAWGKKGE